MKSILKKSLVAVLVLAVVTFGYQIWLFLSQYGDGDKFYEALRNRVTTETMPQSGGKKMETQGDNSFDQPGSAEKAAPEKITCPIDFAALLKICPDIVGWICFPQEQDLSVINYPLVHSPDAGRDKYYLHHLIDGTYNFEGTLFTASFQIGDFSEAAMQEERNTMIYGHNMANGSMFGKLKRLKNQAVLDRNETFLIYTPQKAFCYKILAVYDTKDQSEAYTDRFENKEDYLSFLQQAVDSSAVKTNAVPDPHTHTVTLSTCQSGSASSLSRVICVAQCVKVYEYE